MDKESLIQNELKKLQSYEASKNAEFRYTVGKRFIENKINWLRPKALRHLLRNCDGFSIELIRDALFGDSESQFTLFRELLKKQKWYQFHYFNEYWVLLSAYQGYEKSVQWVIEKYDVDSNIRYFIEHRKNEKNKPVN